MFGMYPFENNTVYVNDAIVRTVVSVLAAVGIGVLMFALTLFLFRAASLYKIARRRGIRRAWLAWIPVCSDWVLGSVADQYQYVVKERVRNRRLPLLLLSLAMLGLSIVSVVMGIGTMTNVLRMLFTGNGSPNVGRAVLMTVLSMTQTGATIAYLVVRGIALYDFYSSCTSRYNVVFLVLGLIFRVLEPVFFFVCRNKEEGMPPRREVEVCAEV